MANIVKARVPISQFLFAAVLAIKTYFYEWNVLIQFILAVLPS